MQSDTAKKAEALRKLIREAAWEASEWVFDQAKTYAPFETHRFQTYHMDTLLETLRDSDAILVLRMMVDGEETD